MKIFITGATGYLGGSIASKLINQGHTVLGLVRSPEKAARLATLGIVPIMGSLDDVDALQLGASQSDATINAANSDHYNAARVLIEVLAGTGKTLIHTSGSSIVVDDACGEYASDIVFSDDRHFRPMLHRVPRIAIDRMVRSAGINDGIRTCVICPAMVYGEGLGLKLESDQLPQLVRKAKEKGYGVYIGNGANIWSNVFIADLVDLYLVALDKAPSASFFYAENGEASMKDVAQAISLSLQYGGKIASWSTEDAYGELGLFARVALATNCRVRAIHARTLLAWKPNGPTLKNYLLGGS